MFDGFSPSQRSIRQGDFCCRTWIMEFLFLLRFLETLACVVTNCIAGVGGGSGVGGGGTVL